jgi:hypothetical protein
VYDLDAHELAGTDVWVNGSTSIVFQTAGKPSEIRLDYSSFVIVQLPNTSTAYYSTDQIETSNLYVVLLGTGVVTAVIAVPVTVCLVKKRR